MDKTEVASWKKAFHQAANEPVVRNDHVVILDIAFSRSGDLVVFFEHPSSKPRAWVYDLSYLGEESLDAEEMLEFARLSLLGDLIPPAQSLETPRRPALREMSRQYPGFDWCGAVGWEL